jgi:hypothetical protein
MEFLFGVSVSVGSPRDSFVGLVVMDVTVTKLFFGASTSQPLISQPNKKITQKINNLQHKPRLSCEEPPLERR